MRRLQLFALAVAAFAVLESSLFAQAPYDPVLDQGIMPFQSYEGGNLDSVNLATGALNLHIPLVSFPQRGGKLDLRYFITHSNFGLTMTCPGYNQPCYFTSAGIYVSVINGSFPGINTATYSTGTGTYEASISIKEADGSTHLLGWTSSSQARAVDGSGFFLDASSTITDGRGVRTYQTTPGSTTWITSDPNGNQMTHDAFQGVTDTLGRVIPNPPGVGTQDFSNCHAGTTIAFNWVIPAPGGNSATYKICGATGPAGPIILPDSTKYDFQYVSIPTPPIPNTNPGSIAAISKIVLPSGGSVSYGYGSTATQSVCSATTTHFTAPVISRTVDANDGSGPQTWTYSRQTTANGIVTTVTDPLGNTSVHTFQNPLGICQPYESQDQEYDNQGHLLKATSTTYSFVPNNPNYGGVDQTALDVLPTSRTTVWPNGQQRTVTMTYDKDHGSTFSFGVWKNQVGVQWNSTRSGYISTPWSTSETDYAQGGSGAVLRTTNITYLAFASSNYFGENMFDLASSVQVLDGAGSQRSYTTYGYDEAGLQSSGVAEQKVTGESYPGNQTSVHRWLSNGSAVAQAPCNVSVASGGYLVTSNIYFDTGEIQKSTDPCLYPKSYLYSPTYYGAYPTTVTNALSQNTTFAYDFNTGLITSITDPNLQPTAKTYDIMGRLTAETYSDGGSTSYCYTDIGGATCNQASSPPYGVVTTKAITSNLSETSTTIFDGLGRVSQTQLNSDSPSTTYTRATYDALGRKSQVYNPTRCNPPTTNCGETTWGYTTYTYDALNRVTSVVEQDGSTVSTNYGAFPCTTATDEAGKSRKSCVDGLGSLTGVWEDPGSTPHLNYETDYTYNALGDLTNVTQKGSDSTKARMRSFAYDSLSRLTSVSNPESGTISYGHDADGNVTSKNVLSPNQPPTGTATVTTTYTYDVLNRLAGKSYNDGYTSNSATPGASYAYDGNTLTGCSTAPPGLTDSYPVGRRTSMCDGSGGTSWAHDKLGRTLKERRTIGTVSGDYENDTFNLDGSVATVTSLGYGVTYTYGGAGRPVKAMHSTTNLVTSATYAPPGELTGMTLGSATGFAGINSTNAYNNRLQPILLSAASPSGTVFSECFDFHLHVAVTGPAPCLFSASTAGDTGNVYQIANNRDNTRIQNFIYDSLNRIQQAYSSGTQWGETFGPSATSPGVPPATPGIDAWGNLTNRSGVTGKANYESWSVSAGTNNRLTGFGYDPAGNMTSNSAINASYVYDDENRLIWTNLSSGYRYLYDGNGDRVEKCVAATSTTACPTSGSNGSLYWKGATSAALSETDLSGNVLNTYIFFNGQRVARSDSTGTIHYYFSDHLGSHGVVENATGSTCEQDIDYYPYGGAENDYCPNVVQKYKFTGKERDSESGLDYFGARYDASNLGRFMTPDSGVDQHPEEPQSWNLYAYARNNPLLFVDPSGEYVCGTSMTQQQCTDFQTGLDKAQDAANAAKDKYGANSDQYKDAQRAIDAYGKAGVDNGVTLQVGDTGKYGATTTVAGGAAKTADNPTGQNIGVKFSAGLVGDAMSEAHEGSHAADGSAWVASGFSSALNPTRFQTEQRAYRVTDTISEGLGNLFTTMSFGSHPTHTYLLDHIAWPAATKGAAISNIIKHEYPNSQVKAFQRNTKGGH
jgi:RHS repeat-associated protein